MTDDKRRRGIVARMLGIFSRRRKNGAGYRVFDAAKSGRLLNDWVTSDTTIDRDLESALVTLRARSRDLCRNNDYGRRYLWLLASNIVGAHGIRLQMKIKNRSASGWMLDKPANDMIEQAWERWCRPENCTASRRHGFADVLRLVVTGMARDGEAIVRLLRGFDNPFGFALQLIEPDYLDHTYNDADRSIRMGVELDGWKRPIAYHITNYNPSDSSWPARVSYNRERQRVPADEILHLFVPEHAEQTRGYPWTATALRRLHIAGKYEEAELVAARVAAGKMGFYTKGSDAGYPYDDKDSSGNLIDEVSPGKFQELPQGYDFKAFDPTHPNTAFPEFMRACLRGAASGLNVSYISLGNDLSDTSYSSGRQGLLEERSYYMLIQQRLVESLVQPVFDAWLPMAIISGEVGLQIADIERYRAATWQPRRWQWIDPRADIDAAERAVVLGINSRARVAAEQGVDVEDVFEELAREDSYAGQLGIVVDPRRKDSPDKDEDKLGAAKNSKVA